MTDIPTPPSRVHPTPAGMAKSLKNPKVLVAVAVLAVGFVLYFRHKGPSVQTVDGTGTPVGPDPYNAADLNGTQGATGVGGGSGDYGGYSSPDMAMPDWLSAAPDWVVNGPAWAQNGNEPPATNSSNPVTIHPGDSLYDPGTGTLVTAPVTGGGMPNTTSKKPPPKATPTPGKAAPVTNQSGNKNQGKRYVVRKRPLKKGGKPMIWHDYESAYGKGDWGKGGSVNMGPA